MGLSVPLVYNTGGYDAIDTLQLLDGIFDIYMPDFKFTSVESAATYSDAPDYPQITKAALKEMYRQVGDLETDNEGIALRGILVRHLVLPAGLAGTREAMRFLAKEISPNTYVNIMDRYHPCGNLIPKGSLLDRQITSDEFREAVQIAQEEDITHLDRE
jgi:putative pyruvate formate lyase activating enzyme